MRAPTQALLLAAALVACDGGERPPDASPTPADASSADGAAPDATPRDATPGDATAPSPDGATPDAPCAGFESGVEAGRIESAELTELSGLAASRLRADVLYANNDSGDAARVFLLGLDGRHLGVIALNGAVHRDYEDIAVGPGPDGESWVHVGDIGDNVARTGGGAPRADITLYRFPEPVVDPAAAPLALDVTPEAITLTYPGAPHDCESLAVDPDTGDVYLLTKEDAGPSTLYVARAPLASPAALEAVVTVDIGGTIAPGARNATAMDLSPRGHGLLVRTYNRVHLFTRAAAETWADALTRPALRMPVRIEGQGEAIAWRADGRGYYTASEGAAPPLFEFAATDPACTPL